MGLDIGGGVPVEESDMMSILESVKQHDDCFRILSVLKLDVMFVLYK